MTVKKICFMCVMMLMVQPVMAATTTAVQEMAGVLVSLEHYPTDSQKSRLMELARTAGTQQEKVVANAIANLNHTVADADKPKLKLVIDDETTPAEVRDLAGIILKLNHKPSSTDKNKLQQIMGR